MKIDDALAKFLTQLEADGRSSHTISQYARHIRTLAHWAREVGHCGKVTRITHEDLARFMNAPQARLSARGGKKKAGSVNCLRSSLKGFFSYLHRAGYLTRNPSTVLRRAICGQPAPRALSDKEASRLMDLLAADETAAGRRDHALFHLMLAAGLRLTAALRLKVEDVDLERATVEVTSAKGDRNEKVVLSKAIRSHLKRHIGRRKSGILFPSRSGTRMCRRHAHRRLVDWLAKAGIHGQYSPHSLRHGFAMNLYRKTGDILLVKAALHHRSIESTLVYARADESQLRRALA